MNPDQDEVEDEDGDTRDASSASMKRPHLEGEASLSGHGHQASNFNFDSDDEEMGGTGYQDDNVLDAEDEEEDIMEIIERDDGAEDASHTFLLLTLDFAEYSDRRLRSLP